MGLADGYVPPKWKDKDWKVRLKGVKELDDQKILTELAKNDPKDRVRVEAFKRITDKSAILAKMYTRDELYQDIRKRVLTFDDEEVLAFVALKDSDINISMKALKKISDESILKKIAHNKYAYNEVRLYAATMIKDDNLIDKINRDIEIEREKMEKEEEEKRKKQELLDECVDELVKWYDSDSFTTVTPREIGRRLNEAGGFDLMLQAHRMFTIRMRDRKLPRLLEGTVMDDMTKAALVKGHARNLEMAWDGIGSWKG